MEVSKRMHNKQIGFIEALCVMLMVLGLLGTLIIGFKMSPHVPILMVITLLLFYGRLRGFSWDEIHDGIIEGIRPGIIPIIIFMLIGVLVATWMAAGTIPTIMVFGFHLLSARFFLPLVFIICGIVGMTVGSSFTTISTIGIALLGVGQLLHVNSALTAGAVVSGAFLGNNLSPLSDTTNLAAGLAEVNLYQHIKAMAAPAIPAAVISLLIYTWLGHNAQPVALHQLDQLTRALAQQFNLNWVTLLPAVWLLLTAWFKIPAIAALLSSAGVALLTMLNQPSMVFSGPAIDQLIMSGFQAHTGDRQLDTLLSRGGINGMLGSIALIILALTLGGLLIKYGIINQLIHRTEGVINTPAKLILMTTLSAVGINLLVGEQYLSIILPGETYKPLYKKLNVPAVMLSRTLDGGGAAVNSLIPWGVSGVFIAGTLGVSPLAYIPFAFYPYLEPLITVILGFFWHKRPVSR
ncbi:na+ H+ antiporter NhaC [Lacticaseibacillus saniviri JCM 17471 = DSM 24301]|uniref:Na+ H+ antiporter NhaC n=2 Tax=Lacticaseibacillus saniviri TaxID=931533 RepID=A0A0R2MQA1_9LACO|nr:na+ H+ antiporter NhaC [Lacticaseibacillus saniviri JCM 17471 = DSM 24301]